MGMQTDSFLQVLQTCLEQAKQFRQRIQINYYQRVQFIISEFPPECLESTTGT